MTRRHIEDKEARLPPYSVHKQHASEPGRRLIGPPISRHETYTAAVDDAKARNLAGDDKTFVVRAHGLVQWPI
jgi:hypothetical protein